MIDDLTQRPDKEILQRQRRAVKPYGMAAAEAKRGIKDINVVIMVIMVIAADISMTHRNSLAFKSWRGKENSSDMTCEESFSRSPFAAVAVSL